MTKTVATFGLLAILYLTPSCVLSKTAQVLYLGGITYLLPDECPDPSEFVSQRSYNIKLAEYKRCYDSSRTLQTQCVTDTLQSGKKLTVPVYTDLCSAICHGSKNHHDCPYQGVRLDGRGKAGKDEDANEVKKKIADSFIGR
eukprot:TRINITY_DN10734_c0_g1_i1.p1 TRINITY_DN10734_c0_g1~~TRINITY_DN10734_c0_g1_i1.p1  ORF type:complete len:142 (-),score=7.79 TRINITY_DN10734_c0_g1_i1:214-639(-)